MITDKMRVAVVDDDDSVRNALQRILKVQNISVEGFASGEQFLASLPQATPDCVVLDLHMPGLSGLEVQQRISGAGHRLPVVVVTGHHEPGLRQRCISAGASVYLRKPVDAQVLREAIDQAIAAFRN
jgi:FixJ family two-component response regulator